MSGEMGRLRTPSEVGYLAWLTNRLSAIALGPLLALHTAVALFPQYGFGAVYQWSGYTVLLDVTLGLVLLHGILGARATVLETRLDSRGKTVLIWAVSVLGVAIFTYRLLG